MYRKDALYGREARLERKRGGSGSYGCVYICLCVYRPRSRAVMRM